MAAAGVLRAGAGGEAVVTARHAPGRLPCRSCGQVSACSLARWYGVSTHQRKSRLEQERYQEYRGAGKAAKAYNDSSPDAPGSCQPPSPCSCAAAAPTDNGAAVHHFYEDDWEEEQAQGAMPGQGGQQQRHQGLPGGGTSDGGRGPRRQPVVVLAWHDIHFRVQKASGGKLHILRGISGVAGPVQVRAQLPRGAVSWVAGQAVAAPGDARHGCQQSEQEAAACLLQRAGAARCPCANLPLAVRAPLCLEHDNALCTQELLAASGPARGRAADAAVSPGPLRGGMTAIMGPSGAGGQGVQD